MPVSSWLIRRFYRCRIDIRAEALAQSLDRGIRLERRRGPFDLLSLGEHALPRGRFEVRLSRFERDANVPAEMLGQALRELVVDRPRTPVRRRLIEYAGPTGRARIGPARSSRQTAAPCRSSSPPRPPPANCAHRCWSISRRARPWRVRPRQTLRHAADHPRPWQRPPYGHWRRCELRRHPGETPACAATSFRIPCGARAPSPNRDDRRARSDNRAVHLRARSPARSAPVNLRRTPRPAAPLRERFVRSQCAAEMPPLRPMRGHSRARHDRAPCTSASSAGPSKRASASMSRPTWPRSMVPSMARVSASSSLPPPNAIS